MNFGQQQSHNFSGQIYPDPTEAEFKIFSQFGEDGILQYLLSVVSLPQDLHTFVEFGVETFREANCRFLMMKDNWSGLVLDGCKKNIKTLISSNDFWRYDLRAVSAFVDRDNINDLLSKNGMSGDIGILSIDIDGNDYWILDAIKVVNPAIIIAEYNSVFGQKKAITVPYDSGFQRSKAHYSNLYWGASIKALTMLANKRGFELVAGNSAGNNIFFVRRDLLNGLPILPVADAYQVSKFRESRDHDGALSFLSGQDRAFAIAGLPVFDIEKEAIVAFDPIII